LQESGYGKVGRETLKIGEESLSGSASWSWFGHSSIHSKFLTHCLMDRKGRALLRRARSSLPDWWKGARSLEKGALKFAWLMESGALTWKGRAQVKWHYSLLGTYWFSMYTVSRWCSSGCVHKGCGGVHHWLQTEDWALPDFLL
jgi:hypothetical protein